jgi:branched-chain amino acid transport system substrate-binding protein
MPIVNFHITGSADSLQLTLTVRDDLNGALLTGTRPCKCPLPALSAQFYDLDRQLKQRYTAWLQGSATLTPQSPPIDIETNGSISQECQQLGDRLIDEFNKWIGHATKVQNALLNAVSSANYDDNRHDFCFILNADTIDPALNRTLQRLPFHAWDFLQEYYPHAEISLSTTNYSSAPARDRHLQVLVVQGYDPNINLTAQHVAIGQRLADANLADVEYWDHGAEDDAISLLFETFRTSSPQVLFFIGHSESTNGVIRIWINDREYINLEDRRFKNILKRLKSRGLIFAAFISCDGLGIAQELSNLGIPYLMVSREILPVHVAKEFLDEFLAKATERGVPINIALSHARQHLHEIVEARETRRGCPNASTFPIMFQPEQYSYILNPISAALPEERSQRQLVDRIVQAVNIHSLRTWKIALFLALLIFTPIIIIKGIEIWRPKLAPLKSTPCDESIKGLVYLSCGEKSVLGDKYLDRDARQGMEELGVASPNYSIAVDRLERSWKSNQENPEVLIALSNAKIKLAQQQASKVGQPQPLVKTISVVVPASFKSSEEKYLPISLLAAVAESQRGWNDRNSNNWSLEVMIGNDDNDPETAKKQVVKEILARPMILGTLGHYSSYVTDSVLPLYKAKESMLISATNTATDLGKDNRFFVRTVSSNYVQASSVVEILKRKQISEVELIHGTRIYATTFTNNLIAIAKENNIHVHPSILTSEKLNAHTVMNNVDRHKSKVIILAPDAFIDAADRDNMRQIITKNAGKIPIIGNEVVNEPWLFDQIEQQPELGQNLMFVFAWNSVVDRQHFSPEIYAKAPKWWQDRHQKISHRTVLMYDAANVLIESIDFGVKANMNDRDLKARLPDFIRSMHHKGMTGEINFNGSDRKEDLQGLVRPTFDEKGKLTGFQAPE